MPYSQGGFFPWCCKRHRSPEPRLQHSEGGETRGFLRQILKAPLSFSSSQKIPRMTQKERVMSHLETRILLIGFVLFAFTVEGYLGKPRGSLKQGSMLVYLNMAFLLLLLL